MLPIWVHRGQNQWSVNIGRLMIQPDNVSPVVMLPSVGISFRRTNRDCSHSRTKSLIVRRCPMLHLSHLLDEMKSGGWFYPNSHLWIWHLPGNFFNGKGVICAMNVSKILSPKIGFCFIASKDVSLLGQGANLLFVKKRTLIWAQQCPPTLLLIVSSFWGELHFQLCVSGYNHFE